jgi:CRP-like cAMP-binding protein
MMDPHLPIRNRFLDHIPIEARDRIWPHLEVVRAAAGSKLVEPGAPPRFVWFPINSVVALLRLTLSGGSASIAMVGNEGMVGLSGMFDGQYAYTRAVVQCPGLIGRISSTFLHQEFERYEGMFALMLRYLQVSITQLAQTAVCNRHHRVDAQLCAILLRLLDRVDGRTIPITHEMIGLMLGVRREGVTEAARKLLKAGCIDYSRGKIVVLNRPALESRSCECYSQVRREIDRLMPR